MKKNKSYEIGLNPTIEEIEVIPHFIQGIVCSSPGKEPCIYDKKMATRVMYTDVKICFTFYADLRGLSRESLLGVISYCVNQARKRREYRK